jgi:hypothetical protein
LKPLSHLHPGTFLLQLKCSPHLKARLPFSGNDALASIQLGGGQTESNSRAEHPSLFRSFICSPCPAPSPSTPPEFFAPHSKVPRFPSPPSVPSPA